MTEVALYRNVKGQPVTHASYSARQMFKHCPRQFQLERIDGWSDKSKRAATLFGRCVEAGVQAYEERGREPGTAVHEFEDLWAKVKQLPEFPKLEYTAAENNWDQLNRAGLDLMRLYEVKAGYLPISITPKTLFQQTIRKKIFPGSHLDKLENKAIFDMLTFPPYDHPYLSKIPPPVADPSELVRPLIIDIKTSGVDLETDLVCLDPQLGEYAWQSRIPDIGFLWFVKKSPDYKKGSRVTLLEAAPPYRAGFELVVLAEKWDKVGTGKEAQDIFLGVYIGPAAALDAMEAALKGLRGKARDAASAQFFLDLPRNNIVLSTPAAFTKQRLQFAAARLTQAELDDVGRKVAQTTVEMVRAHEEQYYPKEPGVRFPNQKCNFCAMRWLCLGRPDERDKYLTKRGEEWLDGTGEDE